MHSTAIESKTGLGFKWLGVVGSDAKKGMQGHARPCQAMDDERFPLTWRKGYVTKVGFVADPIDTAI